jgi:hypothetical protein
MKGGRRQSSGKELTLTSLAIPRVLPAGAPPVEHGHKASESEHVSGVAKAVFPREGRGEVVKRVSSPQKFYFINCPA